MFLLLTGVFHILCNPKFLILLSCDIAKVIIVGSKIFFHLILIVNLS